MFDLSEFFASLKMALVFELSECSALVSVTVERQNRSEVLEGLKEGYFYSTPF